MVRLNATEWLFCCISKIPEVASKDLELLEETTNRSEMLHLHVWPLLLDQITDVEDTRSPGAPKSSDFGGAILAQSATIVSTTYHCSLQQVFGGMLSGTGKHPIRHTG